MPKPSKRGRPLKYKKKAKRICITISNESYDFVKRHNCGIGISEYINFLIEWWEKYADGNA